MLIDSHCHLDASEFDADREQVIAQARQAGLGKIIIPAVSSQNLELVRSVAHSFEEGYYALGIHPMYVRYESRDAIDVLEASIIQALNDPKFVCLGEIGLDFFIPEIAAGQARQDQEWFYHQQLKLAVKYQLPVMLHVRKSQDVLLKYLRQLPCPVGGIAHAFNGSFQQAQQFIEQGFALGLGGAMTFDRALQIRRLASTLDLSHFVLETDSPDIAPAWLEKGVRNTPAQVKGVAQVLAQLRGVSVETVVEQTGRNVHRVFPRLNG